MLNWAQQFSIFCFLDNHHYPAASHTIECILAAGARRSIGEQNGSTLKQLQEFIDDRPSWLFGHLGYDLKNEIANLTSSHNDFIEFPDLFFFEPEIIIRLNENEIIIESAHAEEIWREIISCSPGRDDIKNEIAIKGRLSRNEYIGIVNQLRQHILRGDCYEINFCQEFFAENVFIDPVLIYLRLSKTSPNPFSAFYKLNDKYLICASPERYLKRTGSNILSQPIKGTAKRINTNEEEDLLNKSKLYYSAKDRSENVMVVDLVRNDLSQVCREGTVEVNELYGIYPFPQVYQMISTISGELNHDISFTEILRATFPMGSMTGAPKHNVLKLIERYETTKRGIFSGGLGYITPGGDFDFNVVIRSIMYNQSSGYLSYQAGSGITYYSNPENEWEECLLKAEAIRQVLEDVR